MKRLKLALVAAATAAVMAPAAAQGLSYSVGVFSANTDDVRGDSFRPSVELGAGYDFGNGFYLGTDYTTGRFFSQTSSYGELSAEAGFGQELSSGVSYDINVSRSVYPKSGADNETELGLTLGYGPLSATWYKGFDSSGFVSGTAGIDWTLSHSFTEQIGAYVMVKKTYGESSLGYELGASYDLGNNLSASVSYDKDSAPKFVFGLTKGF